MWAWATIAVVVIAAAATAPSDNDNGTIATSDTTADVATTTATTTPPATDPTTTTSTTTTTTTTTTSTTTTTIDPALEADIEALLILDGIQTGSATEVTGALIDAIEPYPLERVDVLTASVEPPNIIISATSGYSTADYQIEQAVEALGVVADLWDGGLRSFAGDGTVKIGLDLTVDGRRWLIPNQALRDIAARRLAPADALATYPA